MRTSWKCPAVPSAPQRTFESFEFIQFALAFPRLESFAVWELELDPGFAML
jgi:hypothetical protein